MPIAVFSNASLVWQAEVREVLAKAGAEWALVERLIELGRLHAADHDGHRFYQRPRPTPAEASWLPWRGGDNERKGPEGMIMAAMGPASAGIRSGSGRQGQKIPDLAQ